MQPKQLLAVFTQPRFLIIWLLFCCVLCSRTITVGIWQLENISEGCQEVHSGVHWFEIGGLWVCVGLVVCMYLCVAQKSDAEYRLVVGPSCFSVLQEAQSSRTRGSMAVLALWHTRRLNGTEVIGGFGVKLMTRCVTMAHHLRAIQAFELQGCNVAQLVCKDLFQAAECEGSAAAHVGGLSEINWGTRGGWT